MFLIDEYNMKQPNLPYAALLAALMATFSAMYMAPAAAVGPSNLGNLSGRSVSIGNTFVPGGPGTGPIAFSDIYQFDLDRESSAVGTSVTINLDLPYFAGAEFELSNMWIRFVDSSGVILDSDSQSNAADTTLTVSVSTLPAAHNYQFILSGNVTGTLGGSYGGVLQAYPLNYPYTAPIPEADTTLFMALGIGLVGFLASRRKQ